MSRHEPAAVFGPLFPFEVSEMAEELDFADAFNRLELWVSLTHADVLAGLDDQAGEMMAFATGSALLKPLIQI